MKAKARQSLGDTVQKATYGILGKGFEKDVLDAVGSGFSAVKDGVLSAFDNANKNNVPLPNIPPPNLGSLGGGSNTGTNTGSNGNSG